MDIKTVPADAVFRVFTACPGDVRTLILDVRPYKEFSKKHVIGAYCIRLSANGKVLLDYSKNQYDYQWSEDCWWDKHVIVYGDATLKKDHPVVAFLAHDNHAKSLSIYKEGFEALDTTLPFICTASIKSNAAKRYPSQLDSFLYLGDWANAENHERLAELNVKSVLTIHNNPENLKPSAGVRHLKIEMPDIDSADIMPWFRPACEFIEESRSAGGSVLVHCGAGVSRSAALCLAYLMRRNRWAAQKALEFVKGRRSLVNPNDGFWRSLCALEMQLGITDRSNPNAFKGFHGADAKLSDINEPKTKVTFVPAGKAAPAGAAGTAGGASAAEDRPATGALQDEEGHERVDEGNGDQERESDRRHRRSRSRSYERAWRDDGRRRHRSRDAGRSRDRDRDRGRERGGQREQRSSRSRSPAGGQRSRGRSRERGRKEERPRVPVSSKDRRAKQEAEPAVDLETVPGAVLEVKREGKSLGHLVVQLVRANQECTFGRLPSCDVQLEHLSISRQHAQLTTDGAGNLFVTDLGSAHGTNIDGTWVRANVPKQLSKGSTVQFGASTRQYTVTKLPDPVASR
ncbi:hypothetical protein N2152v2_002370 [Parachlorella kessleri]